MSTERSYIEEEFLKILESDTDGLLEVPEKPAPITATDRLERAFLEIVEFRRTEGRIPSSTTREISERKLGARLDGFLANDEKAELVRHLDEFNLLEQSEAPASLDDILENDVLDLLDAEEDIFDLSTLPDLTQVEDDFDVARREKAKDFDQFKPLFAAKHKELEQGDSILAPFGGVSTIEPGRFFILSGVMLFVAEVGETELVKTKDRKVPKERLRVIFENGTESSMYRQSLASRMGEHNGRSVVSGRKTFDLSEIGDADAASGHIYVLKSLSTHPEVAGIPNLYKIGFSTTSVAERIVGAATDPTYLMAPVEIVGDYRIYNVRPSVIEKLLHRVFAEVRLDISQIDVQGKNYKPAEWFVVPLKVIDQAIRMIISGDIVDFRYDKTTQTLVWSEH